MQTMSVTKRSTREQLAQFKSGTPMSTRYVLIKESSALSANICVTGPTCALVYSNNALVGAVTHMFAGKANHSSPPVMHGRIAKHI